MESSGQASHDSPSLNTSCPLRAILAILPTATILAAYLLQLNNQGQECIITFSTGRIVCLNLYVIPWLGPLSTQLVTSNLFVGGLLAVGFQLGYWFARRKVKLC